MCVQRASCGTMTCHCILLSARSLSRISRRECVSAHASCRQDAHTESVDVSFNRRRSNGSRKWLRLVSEKSERSSRHVAWFRMWCGLTELNATFEHGRWATYWSDKAESISMKMRRKHKIFFFLRGSHSKARISDAKFRLILYTLTKQSSTYFSQLLSGHVRSKSICVQLFLHSP